MKISTYIWIFFVFLLISGCSSNSMVVIEYTQDDQRSLRISYTHEGEMFDAIWLNSSKEAVFIFPKNSTLILDTVKKAGPIINMGEVSITKMVTTIKIENNQVSVK